ncbi:uncharacterized protein LOC123481613 [Coregonus clupeaformis]|uniref:uncharacterized protein LOC123481613 n=1 Tax=Coregonus clupeaformis TaxID=59861 RepID=UPI001E1C283D|nr:uncharacterized protein LOC123481613 [Coregonus clupeaformis]
MTPEDEVRMNSSPSFDDPLTPETPESDVTSDATSLADTPREMTPENVEEASSLEDFLKSHPQRKRIRKFLKQMNVTIEDLEDMSYAFLLPAIALLRISSPESSNCSFRDKELQGTADMVVSNILRNAQEDLFSSGMNDLETTNQGIALTEERLSSALEALGPHRDRGRFDLCHQAVEMERVYLQRDTPHSSVSVRELGPVRRAKRRDVHKALSEGSLNVFALFRERAGEIWQTSTWDMEQTQPPSTPTSSEEDLWDSDSSLSHGVGEEERGSSLILTPQASTSLSDQDKRALEDVCQILTAWLEKRLNRTCNDNYRASVIIQKGLDSGARDRFPYTQCPSSSEVSVMTVLHSEPSTSTKAARAAPAQTLEFNPCLDEDEVVPSTSMGAGFLTTTQAAWAAPAQTLEEEVGGADVSEVSTSSLTPTEARQGLLGKIPSLLPGEILIEEDISFRSTPRNTVMSPQTLKLILQGIIADWRASEFPRPGQRPLQADEESLCGGPAALKYANISVLFSLEESIQFRGKMQ